MKNIPIIAKPDHLTSVTRAKNPLSAIAELIWNALDAEADVVEIETVENQLGGLEIMRVKDNGFGLPYDYAFPSFGSLGGSWKRDKRRTDVSHRKIHGRNGKGRFQAFSIGNCCEWEFTYSENEERFQYTVLGVSSDLASFSISDDKKATSDPIGATVTISDIHKNFPSFLNEHATLKLAEVFALFLTQYPDIKIIYNGERISPDSVIADTTNLVIKNESIDKERAFRADIKIIEWSMAQEHSLVLCNSDGYPLREIKPRIQTPRFSNWTAYVKSDSFAALDDENRLELEEMDSDLEMFISLSKEKVRRHFRKRESLRSETLLKEWKMDELYPYDDDDYAEIFLQSESQTEAFDLCALNINSHLTGFENSSRDNKKLTFLLLKEILEENPAALKKIFDRILNLPKEKQSKLESVLNEQVLTY